MTEAVGSGEGNPAVSHRSALASSPGPERSQETALCTSSPSSPRVMASSESLYANGTAVQAAADGQPAAPNGDGPKRKAEPGSGTHTRAKRNRYISIAWYVVPFPLSPLTPCPLRVFLF